MLEWYYILGAIAYGIFIIKGIFIIILGDFDFDGDVDFDVGDLFSFKGLLHFLLGFTGWLMITEPKTITTIDIIISICIGIMFMIALYYIYYCIYHTLFNEPTVITRQNLIGKNGKIYLRTPDGDNYLYYVQVPTEQGTIEIDMKSSIKYEVGEEIIIN